MESLAVYSNPSHWVTHLTDRINLLGSGCIRLILLFALFDCPHAAASCKAAIEVATNWKFDGLLEAMTSSPRYLGTFKKGNTTLFVIDGRGPVQDNLADIVEAVQSAGTVVPSSHIAPTINAINSLRTAAAYCLGSYCFVALSGAAAFYDYNALIPAMTAGGLMIMNFFLKVKAKDNNFYRMGRLATYSREYISFDTYIPRNVLTFGSVSQLIPKNDGLYFVLVDDPQTDIAEMERNGFQRLRISTGSSQKAQAEKNADHRNAQNYPSDQDLNIAGHLGNLQLKNLPPTMEDLKKHYHRFIQSHKLHPDHGGDRKTFEAVKGSYEELMKTYN